jgi:hypothetical protein
VEHRRPYPIVGIDFLKGCDMTRFARFAAVALLLFVTSACALRSPRIADLQNNPARYHDRTVRINGTVTSSWGVPLVPFKFYRVDDGTGEVIVLSNSLRSTPTRGTRVSVKGTVDDVAVLGGQAVGLHVKEEKLSIKR